jgi:hypothetical protein
METSQAMMSELVNACKDVCWLCTKRNKNELHLNRISSRYVTNEYFPIGNFSDKRAKTFKYLCYLLRNRNSIDEQIKCGLKAGNSCYFSVKIKLSSKLYSINMKT